MVVALEDPLACAKGSMYLQDEKDGGKPSSLGQSSREGQAAPKADDGQRGLRSM